jgi:lipoprotein
MRKNFKIIIMGMIVLSALSFTACKSVEKKEDAVTTEAAETKSSIDETTEAKKDNTGGTSLILGQIDGEVYTNKMFNIKFDAGANQMTLLTDSELGQMGNSTDRNDLDAVKSILDSGNVFMDMYANGEEHFRSANVIIENISGKGVKNAKEYADKSVPLLKNEFESMGFTEINIESKEEKFLGEDIASIIISITANGTTQYQKQVIITRGDYVGIITVTGKDEADAQSLLDMFTKAE